MTKKILLGLVVPALVIAGLVALRVSLSVRTIIGIAAVQFIAQLVTYPNVWRPRKFSFGRLTLMALTVSVVSAAILWIGTAH